MKGKILKNITCIIIFVTFIFMNATLVFAGNKFDQALEDFEFYYSSEDFEYSFKSFILSEEYKTLKEKDGNKEKTDTDLYVEYYLGSGSDQAVKNFYRILSEEYFDLDKLSTEEYNFAVDMSISLYGHQGKLEQSLGSSGAIDFHERMEVINNRIQKNKNYDNLPEDKKNSLKKGSSSTKQSSDISKAQGKTGTTTTEKNGTIYQQPTVATNKTSGSTLDDMMTDADNFVQAGENDKIKASDLQRLSRLIYNIALQIGIGVAVIAGLALGIQFMMSSVEGKADVKKGLKIYVIGCVVVFGSFGIWKLIVTIMQQI